jgi:hypothetical protein
VSIALEEPDIEFLGVLNDGMQTVRGVLHVAAEADLVYQILTDYDSCSRVFRNIAETQTVFTPGGKQVVQVSCLLADIASAGQLLGRVAHAVCIQQDGVLGCYAHAVAELPAPETFALCSSVAAVTAAGRAGVA